MLAAGIGFACQRGNTCAVAAVDDLVFRRSVRRLTALVYTWAIIGGGLAIVNAASHLAVSSASITIWPIAGGALLGGGAVLNGSCTTGAVCRVGSGEYRFALAVVGFFLGCLVAPALFGSSATQPNRRPVSSATLQHPWLSTTAGLVALFTGAVIGGRTQRGARPVGPLSPHMLRCLAGGTVMGLGYSLTHSAFDGLTFVSQPLLLPLAWTTMAATYAAITLGIAVLRSPAGTRATSLRGTPEMPAEMFSGR